MSLVVSASQTHFRSPVPALVLNATDGGTLVIPLGAFLLTANYARVGGDLVLTGPGGEPTVVIQDFFLLDNPPALVSENGAMVDAALASRLAGVRAPGQYTAADGGVGAEPIGRVAEISGEATATRVDGTKVLLAKDTPVFQGDIIETASGAVLEVVFIDESSLSVGEDGRLVLDELVFDPSTLQGESTISVLQGVFVFVSGEIAANNPAQMAIKTPVATIGVRGTAVAISAAQEGEQNKIVLLTEQTPDGQATNGSVVITNESGTVVLDQAFETSIIDSMYSAPAPSYIASPNEVMRMVSQIGDAAPDSVQHLTSPSDANHTAAPGTPGQTAAQGDDTSPGPTAEGETPPDTPPLDASIFAEEPGLFEDAALLIDAMLIEEGTLPPDDPALLDESMLDLDGSLADESTISVASPSDGTTEDTLDSFATGDATLTGDPFAADNLSGGIGGDTLGGADSYGTIGSPTLLDPILIEPITFLAPPPPPPPGPTSSNGDQFLVSTSTLLTGLVLIGTASPETLNGSDFGDFIDGRGGNDSLFGFGGADILIGDAGNDLIDGGSGFDYVEYFFATSGGVTVDLGAGTASGGADVGSDILVSIEGVGGTTFNDTLIGSTGDNIIVSGGGSDIMTGAGGNDLYIIDGAAPGLVTVNDAGDSSTGDMLVLGGSGGGALPVDFDYTISGNNLTIRHAFGNPATEQVTIQGHLTTGTIELFQFIDATGTLSGLALTLKTGAGTAIGTTGSDFIAVADTVPTTLDGGGGDDYLIGNSGADVLIGGIGADAMNGNGGGDTLNGGAGDDFYLVIPTSGASEFITDSAGTDFIEVGGVIGFTAENVGSDLVLTFPNGTTLNVLGHFGGAQVEFISVGQGSGFFSLATGTSGTSIGELIAGGAGAQTLSGGAGDDLLYGASGADVLVGGSDFDILVGGIGVDTLTGGSAAGEFDRFRYLNPLDGTATTNGITGSPTSDQITDFESGTDIFEFLNTAFGFGGSTLTAVDGTTFFTMNAYDGTNAPASGSAQPHFVFDPANHTLYHDDGSAGTGYTVIATVQAGGTVTAGDIQVSSLGGPSAY